jgi:NAD(P)-dependent dehydrogenase (short-subunit alcohol dehydrogenase family)
LMQTKVAVVTGSTRRAANRRATTGRWRHGDRARDGSRPRRGGGRVDRAPPRDSWGHGGDLADDSLFPGVAREVFSRYRLDVLVIAEVVGFLAGERASYVTGQVIGS